MKNLFKKSLLALVMLGFIFNVDAMKRPAPNDDINPNPEKKHLIELSDSDLQGLANKFVANIKSILTNGNPEFENNHEKLMSDLGTLSQENRDIVKENIRRQLLILSKEISLNILNDDKVKMFCHGNTELDEKLLHQFIGMSVLDEYYEIVYSRILDLCDYLLRSIRIPSEEETDAFPILYKDLSDFLTSNNLEKKDALPFLQALKYGITINTISSISDDNIHKKFISVVVVILLKDIVPNFLTSKDDFDACFKKAFHNILIVNNEIDTQVKSASDYYKNIDYMNKVVSILKENLS